MWVLRFLYFVITPFSRAEGAWSIAALALAIAAGVTIQVADVFAKDRRFWTMVLMAVLFAIAAIRLYYRSNRRMSLSVSPIDRILHPTANDEMWWVLRVNITNDGARQLSIIARVLRPVTGLQEANVGNFLIPLEHMPADGTLHEDDTATLLVAYGLLRNGKQTFLFCREAEGSGDISYWEPEVNPDPGSEKAEATIQLRDSPTSSVRYFKVAMWWTGELPNLEVEVPPQRKPIL